MTVRGACARLAAPLVLGTAVPLAAQPAPAAPAALDAPRDTGVVAVHRAWWHALAVGDMAYLRRHTVPQLSLTLSVGRAFDRAAMLADAAGRAAGAGAGVTLRWTDAAAVRPIAPTVAVVTSRASEGAGAGAMDFRYLTVLERRDGDWLVTAAQSTRVVEPTARVAAAAAGALADYAGAYRTPRGTALRVMVRDSALVLVDPSGLENRLEPVGPGLFEHADVQLVNGIVRFAFARDGAGRVATLSRLATGAVTTFPRIP